MECDDIGRSIAIFEHLAGRYDIEIDFLTIKLVYSRSEICFLELKLAHTPNPQFLRPRSLRTRHYVFNESV